MNNYGQPFYGNAVMQPYNFQPMYQNIPQNVQPQMQKIPQQETFPRLQGKSVDSVDVVKAMDIPLDGSISYFPLTDGTAIVSKQLQADGTSKTIIYKPVDESEIEEIVDYITQQQLEDALKKFNPAEYRDDIKSLKRQIKDLNEDITEINEYIKKRKD